MYSNYLNVYFYLFINSCISYLSLSSDSIYISLSRSLSLFQFVEFEKDAGSLDLSMGLEVGGRERPLTLSAMMDSCFVGWPARWVSASRGGSLFHGSADGQVSASRRGQWGGSLVGGGGGFTDLRKENR